MRLGRNPKGAMTPEQRQKAIERVASKKPKLLRRVRNGVVIGALVGALAGSQGPAIRQHHNTTKENMRQGARTVMATQRTPKERLSKLFNRKKATGPRVTVGKQMFSGKDKAGNTHIGKADVAAQTAKTFRPNIQMSKRGGKSAATGAATGAVAGVALGAAGYARKKKKYNKKMRRVMQR
jgi:hypothetical protein